MQDFRRTFDEIAGPEVKIVNGLGYVVAASGIYDLGFITTKDIEKIKSGQPFITPERKQKITLLPEGEIYSLEDVRLGAFEFSGRL